VKFEVTMPTLVVAHCHCSLCRRSHGAAFVTWLLVSRDQFLLKAGAESLSRYQSSEHGTRSFCQNCGSSLFFETRERPDQIDVVLSNMLAPIDREPQLHVHFDDRVDWVEVADSLPRLG
jgi:hypothetical protein